jgi:hypothetical protein
MNCYLCYQETGTAFRPALGVCHLCGAGCCEHHLIGVISTPVAGMAGMNPPKRQLRCSQCHEELISHPRHFHTTTRAGRKRSPRSMSYWLQQLTHQKQPALPSEEEAVTLVERFLKHERK